MIVSGLILKCLSCRKGQDDISSTVSKSSNKSNEADAYSSIHSQCAGIPDEDDDDDFDPRGTSTTSKYI